MEVTYGLEERVKSLFSLGYAPSRIDKLLRVEKGTAHDVMVSAWAVDKAEARAGKLDVGAPRWSR